MKPQVAKMAIVLLRTGAIGGLALGGCFPVDSVRSADAEFN